jgi:cyclophilin family peptidyl-prolyl cis-trans isomerase
MAWYEARASEAMSMPAPVAHIETGRGVLELTLFATDAPLTVYNFTSLARRGYFDGLPFHRVVPNFVVQGGDPRGDGNGGPGSTIRDELNRRRYLRGTLGMALSGPNTGGSQFFVTHSPQPHLDGGYTVFGQLLGDGDVLDRIVQGDRIVRVIIR